MEEKPSTKAASALSLLETVSPKKTPCSSSTCSAKVSPADRFCATCGAENSKYDSHVAEINKSGKRSGWFKPTEQPAIVPENQEEEKIERGMGDLLARLRKQKPLDTETKQKEEPKGEEPVVASASSAAAPLACERTEYDLDNPNHAVEWILSAFAPSKREELKILAEYFVSQLKGSSKNLADTFYKKVISPRLLSTPDRRNLWIASTRENRAKRFVPPPNELWKKNA